MPVYFNHLPAGTSFIFEFLFFDLIHQCSYQMVLHFTGTSLANVVHFGLNVRSKRPQMLDYMIPSQNQECYNSVEPPEISLDHLNMTDVHLISAFNDLLADRVDVDLLKKSLKNGKTKF